MLVRSTNLSLLKLYVDTIPTYDGNVNTLKPGLFTFKYIYLATGLRPPAPEVVNVTEITIW
jgi:hypothetical protein